MKITQYTFNKAQYLQDEYKKTQIYLHHTAGNANPYGVYKDWEKNEERVATCMVVGGKNTPDNSSWVDGEIIQGFASKHWAFHLGLKESTFNKYNIKYQSLDRISIGIEICNWGQLTLKEGKYYNYVNKEVPKEEVVELIAEPLVAEVVTKTEKKPVAVEKKAVQPKKVAVQALPEKAKPTDTLKASKKPVADEKKTTKPKSPGKDKAKTVKTAE